MLGDPTLEALFLEYREMRQEVRDLIASMTTNLQIGILAVSSVVGWGIASDKKVLLIVPTMLFAFVTVHFLKVSSTNILGTYCQVIAERIRKKLPAKERLLDWEGGLLWRHSALPTSIVQLGFYFFFAAVVLLFFVLSWHAYTLYKWTLILHAAEIIAIIFYAFRAMAWNSLSNRNDWLRKHGV